MGVPQRECKITDYDGRSPVDRLSDAGSIPARSIGKSRINVRLFLFYEVYILFCTDIEEWIFGE